MSNEKKTRVCAKCKRSTDPDQPNRCRHCKRWLRVLSETPKDEGNPLTHARRAETALRRAYDEIQADLLYVAYGRIEYAEKECYLARRALKKMVGRVKVKS